MEAFKLVTKKKSQQTEVLDLVAGVVLGTNTNTTRNSQEKKSVELLSAGYSKTENLGYL